MHIIITGERNVGKTTVVDKILSKFEVRPTGFRTSPYFDKKNRLVGFVMMDPSIFNIESVKHEHIIGYSDGVNWEACPETFENYGVSLLEDAIQQKNTIILMDELGFFESEAKTFQQKVIACLDQTDIQVIAVVKKVQTDFLNTVRSHPNTELFQVDYDNRNLLPEILLAKIRIG